MLVWYSDVMTYDSCDVITLLVRVKTCKTQKALCCDSKKYDLVNVNKVIYFLFYIDALLLWATTQFPKSHKRNKKNNPVSQLIQSLTNVIKRQCLITTGYYI